MSAQTTDIILNGPTSLSMCGKRFMTGVKHSYDILVPYVCLFMDSVISDFILMDYNARPERTHLVDEFLKIENIRLMD